MASKKTAQEHAVDFLEKQVASGIWKHGERLPTIANLARMAGTSVQTLWSAIDNLKQSGTITAKRKSGLFLGQTPEVPPEVQSSTPVLPRDIDICQKISRDIIEGKFIGDFLPPLKELSYTYGAGYRTLQKSLKNLVYQGRIVVSTRRYRIVRHQTNLPFNRLVLIGGDDFVGNLEQSYFRSWFYVFLQHLEKECSLRRIRLSKSIYTTRFETTEEFSLALGFIIWLDNSLRKQLDDILHVLAKFNKPVLLIDDSDIAQSSIKNKNVHFFRRGNIKAGFTIGKLLFDAGHKKMCYIARIHEPWAENRLAGLKQAAQSIGLDPEKSVISLFLEDLTEHDREILLDDKERQWITDLVKEHDKTFTAEAMLTKLFSAPFFLTATGNRLKMLGFLFNLHYLLYPLFKKAHAIPGITAWVLGDDYFAAYGAVPFLRKQRIKTPRSISLAGFNNQIEAFDNNLTSYDFNMPAIVGRMMDIIFWPQKKHKGNENPVVEVEGFIAVRGSTGRHTDKSQVSPLPG